MDRPSNLPSVHQAYGCSCWPQEESYLADRVGRLLSPRPSPAGIVGGMSRLKWSTRDFLWAMVLIAVASSWLVDRGRLQLKFREAAASKAELASRLDSTERHANAVERLMKMEHHWLRENHPEIMGLSRSTPADK
jgi:hypothetical protein